MPSLRRGLESSYSPLLLPLWSTPTTKQSKLLKLSDELERAILHGIIAGVVDRDAVEPEELGKAGKVVLAAIHSLLEGDVKPPLAYSSLLLACTEVLGAPKEPLAEYLRAIAAENIGSDAGAILQKVRDKQLIVDLINESSEQLRKGSIDVGLLTGVLSRSTHSNTLLPVSEVIRDGLPPTPTGLELASLPIVTGCTGGLFGLWALAGEPGVGKTALATQISLDVARVVPVVYYDFETGAAVLLDRMASIFRGDVERMRAATTNVFLRDSIRSLDRDLASVPPPALVVVDSIQKLPAGSLDQRRHGLDRWIRRLEELKKRGYSVLLVSEVGRAQYGSDAYIGAFKETGAVEYAADTGIQLLPIQNTEMIEVHIVKNRHRPRKGLVCHLTRKNSWWFREISNSQEREID